MESLMDKLNPYLRFFLFVLCIASEIFVITLLPMDLAEKILGGILVGLIITYIFYP